MKLSDEWRMVNDAQRRLPVDVEFLARSLGLIINKAHLQSDISGMMEKHKDTFNLTVNASDSSNKQRFTIAHEIGHYMLHRHLIGDGLTDDRVYRSMPHSKFFNARIGPNEETEANKFAVTLLMPYPAIKNDLLSNQYTVESMANKYGVSRSAMAIRTKSI